MVQTDSVGKKNLKGTGGKVTAPTLPQRSRGLGQDCLKTGKTRRARVKLKPAQGGKVTAPMLTVIMSTL
ncbi:hypothetical protein DSO57_1016191 [Entomophthora muscae]|uniref:Uncharacterized protein n=1 Tax=Entomophthora muscae TaxID=34485 RepID=A0ACC2UEQ2_9FUNG|nr:hypothetical protein DSO57_1016191 [Entomophthora muscae]